MKYLFFSLAIASSLSAVDLKSSHIDMNCEEKDQKLAGHLLEEIELYLQDVCEDLEHKMKNRLKIKIHPNLKAHRAAIGEPESPEWSIAKATAKRIDIVSPLNPGPMHTARSARKMLRICTVKSVLLDKYGTEKLPSWLAFGIASWKANCLFKRMPEDPMSLQDLEKGEDKRFGRRGGYAQSFSFVSYVAKVHGWDKVLELAANYQDQKGPLYKAWKDEFYPVEVGPEEPKVEEVIAEVL